MRILARWGGRGAVLALVAVLGACGGGGSAATVGVEPVGLARAEVDSLWARADRLYRSGKWSKALTLYERVGLEVPANDTLAIEARFRVAECHLGMRNQLEAAREFRRVSDETPSARLAPMALLRAGDAYAELWRRPELDPTYGQTAVATYQELLSRYPDAPVTARARARIAALEEAFALKEYKAALYYLRLKAYDSAILYLKDLAATYPRAQVTPSALLHLTKAYKALGYQEDLQETCGYIRRFHPTTPGLELSCPVPAAAPDSSS